MDGYYGLIAGHVEANERPLLACLRETKEECGLVLEKSQLKFKLILYRKSDTRTSLDVFFDVSLKAQALVSNLEPTKCTHLKWYSKNNLPKNIIPYVYQVIFSKASFIESGFDD